MNSSRKFRRLLIVTGQVQGVGFRPFVYRTAIEHGLSGTVLNSPEGVRIEIQGTQTDLDGFEISFHRDLPRLAHIVSLEKEDMSEVEGEEQFCILASKTGEGHCVLISPDVATCPDCFSDMNDPGNRRYEYPFTNCTNCGPRYTITRSIPYDRPVTSMACFPLCSECRDEYENPLDRRFHAQPNACPECGPEIWLTDNKGNRAAGPDTALRELAGLLAEGNVVAVKGLGGFHLVCDATDSSAVRTLRERKNRPDKPLAVMVKDVCAAERIARLSGNDIELLEGLQRPIVLAPKLLDCPLAPETAPDTDFIGLMVPYTPLHHVLLKYFSELCPDRVSALVMTSGNMSSAPICIGNREALRRLPDIADFFLFHNRDILIRVDDSVARSVPEFSGDEQFRTVFMRRARGYTPSPVFLAEKGPCVLGTGPELKNTLCLTKGDQAFTSQHIGDMQNLETAEFWKEIRLHLQSILKVEPELIVRDLHPDYLTTSLAEEISLSESLKVVALQHHYAHIYSVLAENRHSGPALGLALDGTGLGEDRTIWGGECLYVDPVKLEHRRLARFSLLRLPGGEASVYEPWRIAYAAACDFGLDRTQVPVPESFRPGLKMLDQILERNINCPQTSSCGRLFDAVSALLGLCQAITYEGQAAILLEKVQDMSEIGAYCCPVRDTAEPFEIDTAALFRQVYEDKVKGVCPGVISRRFHRGLINGLADCACLAAGRTGVKSVGLSGGVMQNLTIAIELPQVLVERGLKPLVHRVLPPNDGCISLGQAVYGQFLLKN
ncbi:carbamoyltransferase HypF [Maridesulfovibrio sp.]|uniref:carbamoyltransferase HypF n=1 Tax=Maridesulfovibrio sp. TaxID=2795000 RepID=UPI002A18DA0A|nr:carbamoyltransferase HypF [Maridesulfovibrio sp.]